MPVVWSADEPRPVEIAEGRGDLTRTSQPVEMLPVDLGLVGDRVVSHAQVAMDQVWVAAAIMRMLTWAVRVPLKLHRRTGDDSRERVRDHPLAAALSRPWPGAGQAQLVQAFLGPLLVHGNATPTVAEGAGGEIRFGETDWRTMRPVMVGQERIVGWRRMVDGLETSLVADDVIHTHWWSPLGPFGVSPLRQLGTTVRIEDAAQRHQAALLRNQARPPSAIHMSSDFLGLDKDVWSQAMAKARVEVDRLHAGPENAGRLPLLPPGLDWRQVGHTAVEAELIDTRRIAREEIAAVYQIPPPMLGILDRATFSNVRELRETAYTDGLGPPLVLIEQALNAQVIGTLLRADDLYLEFDFGGVLRGDRVKEVTALRSAIGTGLMSPNEGRSALNLPRSEEADADRLYLPRNNLEPIGSAPTAEPATQET